jgi:hypothetical protein
MNKSIFILLGMLSSASMAATYAQLFSSQDQLLTSETVNQPITASFTTPSAIAGMDWDAGTNQLKIKEDGIYAILSELQVGTRQYITLEQRGETYYWIELNEKRIANTGTWISVNPNSKSNYISSFFSLPLKAGDKLRFMFLGTVPNIGLITFNGTELHPDSPGIAISIFKISHPNTLDKVKSFTSPGP